MVRGSDALTSKQCNITLIYSCTAQWYMYVYILLMFVMDFLNVICKKSLFERLKLSTPVHNESSSTNDNIE
jgi:hypothetical protein